MKLGVDYETMGHSNLSVGLCKRQVGSKGKGWVIGEIIGLLSGKQGALKLSGGFFKKHDA